MQCGVCKYISAAAKQKETRTPLWSAGKNKKKHVGVYLDKEKWLSCF